jgi:hypothetical protein
MSYPGVEPGDVQTVEPVGTQVTSSGNTVPTPNPLLANASQEMHEQALRNDSIGINPKELSSIVQQSVSDMFALRPNWTPKQEKIRFVISCPSGQKVLAKHLNTMDLLEADLIEEIDFFTKRLFPQDITDTGELIDNEDGEEANIWKVLRDIEKRRRFVDLLNKLLEASVEKPKVINDGVQIATDSKGKQFLIFGADMKPEDYKTVFGHDLPELSEGETYTSAIDFSDKMAIFAELNKPLAVIQPFREESLVGLASMESSESVGGPTE